MTGAIILSIAFGIEVQSKDDPHVETAEQGLGAISIGTSVPAAMFDFIPICGFIICPLPSLVPVFYFLIDDASSETNAILVPWCRCKSLAP